jgi:hypothetical protein
MSASSSSSSSGSTPYSAVLFTRKSAHDAAKSSQLHRAGICASFAMDFCEKQLVSPTKMGKLITDLTYAKTSRIKKITKRQIAYEKTGGDLSRLAALYGLVGEHVDRWIKGPIGEEEKGARTPAEVIAALRETGSLGCYYISFAGIKEEGHAIGIDTTARNFADANYGVFGCD